MKKQNLYSHLDINYKADTGLLSALTLLMQVGLMMIGSVLIWILIFFFIRRYFSLSHYFLIIGVIFGLCSGFIADYHLLKRYLKRQGK